MPVAWHFMSYFSQVEEHHLQIFIDNKNHFSFWYTKEFAEDQSFFSIQLESSSSCSLKIKVDAMITNDENLIFACVMES